MPEVTVVSEAKLAANRANAQLSTGPRTEAGRQRSALNGMKHRLTGRRGAADEGKGDGRGRAGRLIVASAVPAGVENSEAGGAWLVGAGDRGRAPRIQPGGVGRSEPRAAGQDERRHRGGRS